MLLTAQTVNRTGSGTGKSSAVTTNDAMVFDNSNVYSNEQYSQLQLVSGLAAGAEFFAVGVRMSLTGAGGGKGAYWFETDGGASGFEHNALSILWNGNWTILALLTAPGGWVNGDIMRLEARGTLLTVYKNGQVLGNYDTKNDPNQISSGAAGFGLGAFVSNTVTVDNWEGGSLPPIAVAGLSGSGWIKRLALVSPALQR
jgi:hypothetical protein